MRTETAKTQNGGTQNMKTIAQSMGERLTSENKRSWHLELAISTVIFFLGSAILLTSAQVI
jgi:hypothetical protein